MAWHLCVSHGGIQTVTSVIVARYRSLQSGITSCQQAVNVQPGADRMLPGQYLLNASNHGLKAIRIYCPVRILSAPGHILTTCCDAGTQHAAMLSTACCHVVSSVQSRHTAPLCNQLAPHTETLVLFCRSGMGGFPTTPTAAAGTPRGRLISPVALFSRQAAKEPQASSTHPCILSSCTAELPPSRRCTPAGA